MADFDYAKIFGNYGREINGTWKFFVQSGAPPKVVLVNRSVRCDRNLPFHFKTSRFQPCFARQ